MSAKRVTRIFSGIQPSGIPTIGNYLGALRNWVALQDKDKSENENKDVLYMLADLHALTSFKNSEKSRKNIHDAAVCLLACGLDPSKCTIFQQSQVPAHAELGWILQTVTPLGWLNRMTQFKSKMGAKQDFDKQFLGLYAYPSLMAADILLYKATHVPVGHDQTQHLEITRFLANQVHHIASKEIFPIPETVYSGEQTQRIMSLRSPLKKMSKSDVSDNSRINLSDSETVVAKKISKAVTDLHGPLTDYPHVVAERPGVLNLARLVAGFTNENVEDIIASREGASLQDFKSYVTEVVVAHMCPIGAEINRLQADPEFVKNVMKSGNEHAASIANDTLRETKDAIGLNVF